MRLELYGLLALAACGDGEPEMFRADVPITERHRSMIVGLVVGDGEPAVHALEISPPGTVAPIDLRFPLDRDVEITALLYERSLVELEVEAGMLEPELDPDQQRDLPRADRIETLAIRDRALSEWNESPLPAALEAFKIRQPERCGTFSSEVVSLGVAGAPTFVMALDDRWVLAATSTRLLPGESPTVFFVDADLRVVKQSGLPASFFDGYREEGGTIWLGGERGVVYRATFTALPEPRLDVVVSSTVSSQEDIISLVGPPSGVPREHFALTTNRGVAEQWGAFEWFDGERWRVPGLRRNTPHDATWVAPGYGLFASFFRDTQVFGARDGVEIEIHVDSIVFGSVVEIEQIPGLGLVAGTSGGEVHLQPEAGAWSAIANINIQQINGLHRYPDGLVYLAGNSMIRYVQEGIVCEENVIAEIGLDFARSMTVLGEDVIVPLLDRALTEEQLGEQRIAWFRRAPR